MKKYTLTMPAALIMQLDKHLAEFKDEPVSLTLDSDDHLDWFIALGLFDTIRAYSKFMDLRLELRYPSNTYLTFVIAAAFQRDKVFLTDSFFVVFKQSSFWVNMTKTDARILTNAFGGVQQRTLELVAVALDEQTPTMDRWLKDGKLVKGKDYFSQLGYQYFGDQL